MNEALKTLPLPIWLATLRSTSSQALGAGASPCDLPGGPTTDLCGRVAAPANLSARQAKAMGLLTSGTYGPRGSISSSSADLQSSLVSRLKQQLTTSGSTLFRMTWKEKVTPSGRLVCLLRASGHRTSGSAYGSWPTPDCNNHRDGLKLRKDCNIGVGMHGVSLHHAAQLAPWPTPLVNDTSGSTHCYSGKNPDGTNRIALKLPGVVQLAPWPTTTTTRDWKDGPQCDNVPLNSLLGRVVWLSGSDVPMEKRGQLNPRFSLWLMGYPTEWASCAERVMQSSRKSQRK